MKKCDLNRDGLDDLLIGAVQEATVFSCNRKTGLLKNNSCIEQDKVYADADISIFDANADTF
jgi:hypothetical protein